jgi:hypothetical protein
MAFRAQLTPFTRLVDHAARSAQLAPMPTGAARRCCVLIDYRLRAYGVN